MDQTGDMQDAVHKDIMKKAKAKYDLLVNSGKWRAKSADQEKFIALEAQVKELKDLKLLAQLINRLKQGQKGQSPQKSDQHNHPKLSKVRQHQGQGDCKNQKDRSDKCFRGETQNGRKFTPKDNERKQKQVSKKIFN